MLVCLVSQIDQLKANFKLHPQRSQHVDSYVIVAGVEIKFVNFISFQLNTFPDVSRHLQGTMQMLSSSHLLPPVPQQDKALLGTF